MALAARPITQAQCNSMTAATCNHEQCAYSGGMTTTATRTHAEVYAALIQLERELRNQWLAAIPPIGTHGRGKIRAAAYDRIIRTSPEREALRRELQAADAREHISRDRELAEWQREKDAAAAAAATRRWVQGWLRRLGYRREMTSDSGSSYYALPFARATVRVSDHEVPHTIEREDARSAGQWSWSRCGTHLDTTRPRMELARQLVELRRRLREGASR